MAYPFDLTGDEQPNRVVVFGIQLHLERVELRERQQRDDAGAGDGEGDAEQGGEQ